MISGQSPEGKFYNDSGQGLPFYQGKKDFGERDLRPPTVWTMLSTKHAEAGDILMSVRAPVGPINFARNEVCIGRGLAAIRCGDGLDPNYLFYQLLGMEDEIAGKDGAVFASISGAGIKALPIVVPSPEEQRRIVAVLDEAFEGIATAKSNAEKNLQNARELFEARRESVLSSDGHGWAEASLRDLCDIKHGYAFEGQFFAREGDYVLLTPGNYFEAGGYRDRGEKQKYFTGRIPVDYVLSKGDLVVAMTEQAAGLLGSPLLVPAPDRFLHNQRLGLVVAKAGVPWANDFFFHVFNLARVRAEIHASASGVKVRHTSPSKIGAVRVSFPVRVAGQREVASTLGETAAECNQLVAIYGKKIAILAELKRSLLHRAFAGAL